ncbi:hypothetical protein [Burkholderia diffusa]|uniref:hypothetical protein n=1 Tax=Burkholderia diffusa TaxID=488732 RepID=UPI0012DADA43|nr:hypothetical protein [Burkholderia diffusa]
MLLSVDYRSQQLTISPDHNYRIANREMTEQEIQERIHDDERSALSGGLDVAIAQSTHEHRARQQAGLGVSAKEDVLQHYIHDEAHQRDKGDNPNYFLPTCFRS